MRLVSVSQRSSHECYVRDHLGVPRQVKTVHDEHADWAYSSARLGRVPDNYSTLSAMLIHSSPDGFDPGDYLVELNLDENVARVVLDFTVT